MRTRLYLAAPYSSNTVLNTHKMLRIERVMYRRWMHFFPVVPHRSHFADLIVPEDAEFWYAYTLDEMLTCQAIVRFPGESKGADEEMRVAREHEIFEVEYRDLPYEVTGIWEGNR